MSSNQYPQFLFSIGTIEIYELKPSTFTLFKNSRYFWKYKGVSDASGPFNSIMEATRHWESTIPKANTPSNVIYVDFKRKLRIKP